ncbi:probable G-protein coupled receptor 139 [Heterodontus francisci]|uniref:probable G-protein coupled receptor 139 n=1 Tax=Heterodontus francisci TaxID=7792 RepID=UPI00355B1684
MSMHNSMEGSHIHEFGSSARKGRQSNFVAIAILPRGNFGLSTCTHRYLVAMATADLLLIITDVILRQLSHFYFPGSFLGIIPVCCVNIALLRAARDCSVWFTITFSFDRFVAICYQNLTVKYCTKKTTAVILAITCIMLFLKNIPLCFLYELVLIVSSVPLFCYPKSILYTDPGWVGFQWLDQVLIPLLPFALILLLNSLAVGRILVASRVRKGLRGHIKGKNHSDPLIESRRKSVILLFTISGSFILIWLTSVIEFFKYRIAGTTPDYLNDSLLVFRNVGIMLQNLNSCTNAFIYMVTQSKFREQFMVAVKYPVISNIQLMLKQKC